MRDGSPSSHAAIDDAVVPAYSTCRGAMASPRTAARSAGDSVAQGSTETEMDLCGTARSGRGGRATRTAAPEGHSIASSSRWRSSVDTVDAKRSASVSHMNTERCWPPVQPIATVR